MFAEQQGDGQMNLSLESLTKAALANKSWNDLFNQALQNAVETANMVGKQAVRHSDIAIDRQWNVDEVAQLVAKTAVSLDAIAAMIAGKIADSLKQK